MRGLRDRRVLVLGATGFIGRWVARALMEIRARPILAVRDRYRGEDVFQRFGIRGGMRVVDLSQATAAIRLVDATDPDVVINLAGYGVDPAEQFPEPSRKINHVLVEHLCRALRERAGVLVHAGSAAEYGAVGGDLRERGPTDPQTRYGRTKLAGTEALVRRCREYGVRGIVARLFTVYGPGEHPSRLLPSLLRAAAGGEPLPMTEGLQQRDFTHVEDVAEGLLRLAASDAEPGTVVNLATGTLTPVRRFAEQAAGQLSMAPDALRFGELPTRDDEMQHDPVNLARLDALLGWRPGITVDEGIRRTLGFGGS